MPNTVVDLPIKFKLDEKYYPSEQCVIPTLTISAYNNIEPYSIYLPQKNTMGILKNDGDGNLTWGSLDFVGSQIDIKWKSDTAEPIFSVNQAGMGPSSMLFHTPSCDYTIGVTPIDGAFRISKSTQLGTHDVFHVSPDGIKFTNISLPTTLKSRFQGVLTIGNANLLNLETDRNIFYGLESGNTNYIAARENVALGSFNMQNIIDGSRNVAIGTYCMSSAHGTYDSVSMGYLNMELLTTGLFNTAIGSHTLRRATTQNYNTAIGGKCLELTYANNNTGLGYMAGSGNMIGSDNTFLGYQAGSSQDALTNSSALGAGASFDKSNKVQLGNSETAFLGVGNVELTLSELDQVANIKNRTISGKQWSYLGSMNQSVRSNQDVTFHSITTTGASDFGGDVCINGNLTINGSSAAIDSIYHVEHPMLILNTVMPETNSGVLAPGYSGLEIKRGVLPNYRIIFDEVAQTLLIGEIGDLNPVAMREDAPTHGAIPVWNANKRQFVTSQGLTPEETTQLKNINDTTLTYEAWQTLAKLHYASSNLGLGAGARASNIGSGNVYFGDLALGNSSLVAINDSIAIGKNALESINNVAGTRNIGIGYKAGAALLRNSDNVFIGYQAGSVALKGNNVCVGNLSSVASDSSNCVVIGRGAIIMGSGTSNSCILGDSSVITHANAAGSIIIGQGSNIGLGGPVNATNTIVLGSGLSVTPTATNQIYTFPNLSALDFGSFLIHNSTSGQIGRYSGLNIDQTGFTFSSDVWLKNLYFGSINCGLRANLNDEINVFAPSGTLGSALRWDSQASVTMKGNVILPYTANDGNSGIIKFGSSGSRLMVPIDATSSFYGGVGAGKLGSMGSGNLGFGYQALANCTTGAGNSCYGYQSGMSLVGGYHNVCIGYGAGLSLVGGTYNTLVGYNAGTLMNGSNNTALGRESLSQCTSGIENTALGARSLYSNIAIGNTALGFEAGFSNTAGLGNTFLGYKAGYSNVDGNNNLAIGASTNVGTSGFGRSAIGYGASVAGNNQMVLGNNAICVGIRTTNPTTALYVNGDITCTGTLNGLDLSMFGSWINQDVTSGSYPIFTNMRDMTMTGFEFWASTATPIYELAPTRTFKLLIGGSGYIKSKRTLFFAPQEIQYTQNAINYIYITPNGVLGVTNTLTTSLYEDNIVLFELLGCSPPLIKKENHPYNFATAISRYLHMGVGTVIQGNGANISALGWDSGYVQVAIAGEDIVNDQGLITVIPDSSSSAIPITYFYRDKNPSSSTYGKWLHYFYGIDVPLFYNRAAWGPTALQFDEFSIVRIYVCIDNANTPNPQYVGLMDEMAYTSQLSAENAIKHELVVAPSDGLAEMELCQLGYIIITLDEEDHGRIAKSIVQKDVFKAKSSSAEFILGDDDPLGGQYLDGGHTYLTTTAQSDVPPTPNDDILHYKNGSIWLTNQEIYMCVDNTDDNAIWKRVAWSNLAEIALGPDSQALGGGVSLGSRAGASLTLGTGQISIGYEAGSSVQTGSGGIFIGCEANGIMSGTSQIVIGRSSLSTGDHSIALGEYAKAGTNCISIGQKAGAGITNAVGSIYQGYHAGMQYSSGTNVCIGYYAGYNADTTSQITSGCVMIGENAGYYAYGNENTYIGKNVGYAISYRSAGGVGNTGVGYNVGIGDNCNYITAFGHSAHASGGDFSIAIGANSIVLGISSISIGGSQVSANYSIAIGSDCSCASSWGLCLGSGSSTGTGANCIVLGTNNCISRTGTGNNTIIIGNNNLNTLTSGANNIVLGSSNIPAITVNHGNIIVGYSNGTLLKDINPNLAAHNYVLGALCMQLATSAAYNVLMGYAAGAALTSGNSNILLGRNAASSLTTGSNSVCLGNSADVSNSGQVAIGYGAIALGSDTIALGTGAKSVDRCISIGYHANTVANPAGFDCIAIGYNALSLNRSASNIAMGTCCMQNCIDLSPYNVAIGNNSMQNSGVSAYCSALGHGTIQYSNSISASCAFGYQALSGASGIGAITGMGNSAFGYQAMACLAILEHSGAFNSAFGYQAASSITTGSHNVSLGDGSGANLTVGNSNVLIGQNAGNSLISGSDNVIIGHNANVVSSENDQIAIGNGASTSGSDCIAIGKGASAASKQIALGGPEITAYKYNGLNTYVMTHDSLIYNSTGPIFPGIQIFFPTNATPWYAKITIITWDTTTKTNIASTTFEATGGVEEGGIADPIQIGVILQCGLFSGQFDTIVGNSTTILVYKSFNFPGSGVYTYKIKFHAEVHFGEILKIHRYSDNVPIF